MEPCTYQEKQLHEEKLMWRLAKIEVSWSDCAVAVGWVSMAVL